MLKRSLLFVIVVSAAVAGLGLGRTPAALGQAETPALPEPRAEAYQDTNVRAGPGTYYDRVGNLIQGQSGQIIGRSPDSFWLKIVYIGGPDNTGWVFKDLVRVVGDPLAAPTVLPPPTPTLPPTTTPAVVLPEGTATPNPEAGRLPTFTPPAQVVRPTLLPVQGAQASGGFPPALLILSLFVLGSFGGFISLLRRRV